MSIAVSSALRIVKGNARLVLFLLLLTSLLLSNGCSAQAEPSPTAKVPGGDSERGRQAMAEYGCNACHTIPGVRRADATVGPPLGGWAERATIAGHFPNTLPNLIELIQDPQQLIPGSIMPDVGVPEPVARDMSAYLYTLEE